MAEAADETRYSLAVGEQLPVPATDEVDFLGYGVLHVLGINRDVVSADSSGAWRTRSQRPRTWSSGSSSRPSRVRREHRRLARWCCAATLGIAGWVILWVQSHADVCLRHRRWISPGSSVPRSSTISLTYPVRRTCRRLPSTKSWSVVAVDTRLAAPTATPSR
jgi:hypothetical protein